MKITKEQLVDFLSTATYGSDWLMCRTLISEKHLDRSLDAEYLQQRCREDKWADRLFAGGTLVCFDYNDEDDDGDCIMHKLTLQQIIRGLTRAATDKNVCMNFARWWSDGDYDYYDCNNLMQYIMFGEVIYG